MKKYIMSLFISSLAFAICATSLFAAPGGKITIGYACKDVNDTFQTYLIEAAQEYAKEHNIILSVVDAQNDVVKQQDQVRDFITKGVDAILVLIIDSSSSVPITAAAQKANIPLVYVNTNPFHDGNIPKGVYYVGSVEKEAGELQAEYIGKMLGGKGRACILQGQLVHEGAVQRTEGIESKLSEKYPNVKILAKQPANWQKDQAMSVTENWLTAFNYDIQAVFANNDEMALGAVNALQMAGKKDTLVIGIDGTKEALDAIKKGKMAGSIFQDADGQAKGAMEIAAMVVNGGKPQKSIKWIPFILITPQNVDKFLN